jgi:hypothetical protein
MALPVRVGGAYAGPRRLSGAVPVAGPAGGDEFGFALANEVEPALGVHVPADEAAVHRSGEDHGGDGDDQPEQQGQPEIGFEGGDRHQRARVRRHEPVQHRQPRQRRDADLHQRGAAAPGGKQHDGHEQDDAHLEEQRDPDQGCDAGHRPRQGPAGHPVDDCADDALGAAGVREQAADHRAQRDQDADAADGGTDAVGEAGDRGAGPQAGDDAQDRRAQDEREEGVDLQPGDEHHDGGDAEQRRDGQQGVAVGRGRCGCGEQDHGVAPVLVGPSRPRPLRASRTATATSCGAAAPETVVPGSSGSSGWSVWS